MLDEYDETLVHGVDMKAKSAVSRNLHKCCSGGFISQILVVVQIRVGI